LQLSSYDLLITDQKMARVGGIELLKKLRAARMAVPVIMATGTSPQAEFDRIPWLQPAAVLLKPYTIPELLDVVRGVLYAAECPREQSHDPLPRQEPPANALRL
jgi:DNA-binding response OmpR family regulator